jgi:hypothetical protein
MVVYGGVRMSQVQQHHPEHVPAVISEREPAGGVALDQALQ